MRHITQQEITDYVEANIQTFHQRRVENQQKLKLLDNGCCYGKNRKPNKGDYFKLCGQKFWAFISGNDNLYTEIIEPLGHQAKERNEQFMQEYAKVVNKFTFEFITKFCDADGNILWEEIVKFNSEDISQ